MLYIRKRASAAVSAAAVVRFSFLISKEHSSLFRLVKARALHRLVKINLVAVEFRSVHAGEFHFAAHHQTAGAAHAGSVHHNGIHGNHGGDAELFSQLAGKFHHDHRSDYDHQIVADCGEGFEVVDMWEQMTKEQRLLRAILLDDHGPNDEDPCEWHGDGTRAEDEDWEDE